MGRGLALATMGLLACVGPGGKDQGDTGPIPAGVALPLDCSAMPAADGIAVGPTDAATLREALAAAAPGTTFLLADGTYELTGGDAASNLAIPAGVTLRSASGNAAAVVLEGGYATTELVTLAGDGATVAEVTLQHAYGDAIAIRGVSGARVYGVHVIDAGDIGIAVLPERGAYPDDAVIGCASVTRTDHCGVGIDGVQAWHGHVYGATIDAPACDKPGIRFATGSRDTVIERSRVTTGGLVGIALGESEYGEGDERIYDDGPCPDRPSVGHYGGIVRNVFAVGGGVRVEDTCDGSTVAHASVWGGDLAWAFSEDLVIANNLAFRSDGGGATESGSVTPTAGDFVDADGGDLHLVPGGAAIDAGMPLAAGIADDDIDGDARDDTPDAGADELR